MIHEIVNQGKEDMFPDAQCKADVLVKLADKATGEEGGEEGEVSLECELIQS